MASRNLIPLKQSNFNLSDEKLLSHYIVTEHSTYFNQLYKKYSVKVYGKCLALLKEEAAAEDALQDVFVKIFSNLYKFEGKSKFSTWVYSITYNHCIDLIRKKKKDNYIFSDNLNERIDYIEDTTIFETKIERLKYVLEKIPEEDKTVLLMKYQQAMPVKEIAGLLNKSESAIKMKIKRAKNKAKKTYNNIF
ncbi:MAG: RNA polymerase sigma factor [Saprospiraceae bacterium]